MSRPAAILAMRAAETEARGRTLDRLAGRGDAACTRADTRRSDREDARRRRAGCLRITDGRDGAGPPWTGPRGTAGCGRAPDEPASPLRRDRRHPRPGGTVLIVAGAVLINPWRSAVDDAGRPRRRPRRPTEPSAPQTPSGSRTRPSRCRRPCPSPDGDPSPSLHRRRPSNGWSRRSRTTTRCFPATWTQRGPS